MSPEMADSVAKAGEVGQGGVAGQAFGDRLRIDQRFTGTVGKMCCSRSPDRKVDGSGHVEELTLATNLLIRA
jgi:hypothetical protein